MNLDIDVDAGEDYGHDRGATTDSSQNTGTGTGSGTGKGSEYISPFRRLKAKLSSSSSSSGDRGSRGSGGSRNWRQTADGPRMNGSQVYNGDASGVAGPSNGHDRTRQPESEMAQQRGTTLDTMEQGRATSRDGGAEPADDPYAALRAATPTEGWDDDTHDHSASPRIGAEDGNADSSLGGTPASTDPTSGPATQPIQADEQTQAPLPIPGQRKRLSWHGDTHREPSSSRAMRSTLSALRLNSWGGDSSNGHGDSTVRPHPISISRCRAVSGVQHQEQVTPRCPES